MASAPCVASAQTRSPDPHPATHLELFAPEAEWPGGGDTTPAFTPDGRTAGFTHSVAAGVPDRIFRAPLARRHGACG